MDQRPAAVVASVGLQADLPGPEEGAGLSHVPHRRLTVLGLSEPSEAWKVLTAGGLMSSTPVICCPGGHTQVQGGTK